MDARFEAPESASERLFVITGTAIAISGMLKRSTTGGLGLMLLGGAIVARGLQVRQHNYDEAHNRLPVEIPDNHGLVIERTIKIDLPVSQVYAFWRNLENLPRFMSRLISVREHEEGKSTWVAKGPKGGTVTWDAEIIDEERDEVIAWRSLPGASVKNEGAVYFHALPGDKTQVRLYLELHLPLGEFGHKVAGWIGEDPVEQIESDLKRFKRILEEEEFAAPSAPGN